MSPRRWVGAMAVAVAVAASLPGCVSTREKHEEWIQESVRAMERSPGGAKETLSHLNALCSSMSEPHEGDRAVVTDAMIERAADFADRAAKKNPHDAPLILARLGLMWSLAREPGKSEDAFQASVAARPTLEGLRGLMGALGKREAFAEVRRVCGEGAAALADHELQEHLRWCESAAHAGQGTSAAEWLSDADRARWDTWVNKQRAAHAAEARAREEAAARHAERERKLGVCRATCDEKGAACKTQCRRDQPTCAPACDEMAAACRAKCEASIP